MKLKDMPADWECPCDQCMGRIEPPDCEPSPAELAEAERDRDLGPSDFVEVFEGRVDYYGSI